MSGFVGVHTKSAFEFPIVTYIHKSMTDLQKQRAAYREVQNGLIHLPQKSNSWTDDELEIPVRVGRIFPKMITQGLFTLSLREVTSI